MVPHNLTPNQYAGLRAAVRLELVKVLDNDTRVIALGQLCRTVEARHPDLAKGISRRSISTILRSFQWSKQGIVGTGYDRDAAYAPIGDAR